MLLKLGIMDDYFITFFNELGRFSSFGYVMRFMLFSVFSFFSGCVFEMFLSELIDKYRSYAVILSTLFVLCLILALCVWSGFYMLFNSIYEVRVVTLVYFGIHLILGFCFSKRAK